MWCVGAPQPLPTSLLPCFYSPKPSPPSPLGLTLTPSHQTNRPASQPAGRPASQQAASQPSSQSQFFLPFATLASKEPNKMVDHCGPLGTVRILMGSIGSNFRQFRTISDNFRQFRTISDKIGTHFSPPKFGQNRHNFKQNQRPLFPAEIRSISAQYRSNIGA